MLPWNAAQPPTAAQLELELKDDVTLPVVVINDGRILSKNLEACGRNEAWMRKELSKRRLKSPAEAFLMTVDEKGKVFCVPKEKSA